MPVLPGLPKNPGIHQVPFLPETMIMLNLTVLHTLTLCVPFYGRGRDRGCNREDCHASYAVLVAALGNGRPDDGLSSCRGRLRLRARSGSMHVPGAVDSPGAAQSRNPACPGHPAPMTTPRDGRSESRRAGSGSALSRATAP